MLTTLPTSCAVVTKSGNLNFLEPSGPLRACNGTDLPLFIKLNQECNKASYAYEYLSGSTTILTT